jgi:hypothetical protein
MSSLQTLKFNASKKEILGAIERDGVVPLGGQSFAGNLNNFRRADARLSFGFPY